MPDDHSEVVPLLPIPNRTVKRLCADDSADSRVKVGHCQAITPKRARSNSGPFFLGGWLKGRLLKCHFGKAAQLAAVQLIGVLLVEQLHGSEPNSQVLIYPLAVEVVGHARQFDFTV